jgi:5-formyltetrahydrofolate cyclo-ligase
MTAKSALRKKILLKLAAHTPKDLRARSLVIQKKMLGTEAFKSAKCLCVYISLPKEAGTREVIKESLKLGKKVLVPLADLKTKELKLYAIKNLKTDVKKGPYGIFEPKPAKTKLTPLKEADLVVVPGVVFDRHNHRVGRGAGFYDRFLKKAPKKTAKIGLAFSFQVVSKVPVEGHDQRLDKVITD